MFRSELVLDGLQAPDMWAIAQPLIWQEPGLRVVVPVGFITDLASIPKPLRGLLDVCGRSRRPAALHDFAYHSHDLSRAEADDLLRRALIAEGESRRAARVYWLGVRLGGSDAYYGHIALTAADFTSKDAYRRAMGPVRI